ncbi:hypothetical protein Taro_017804 [Colocasia esculenta]|uniref:Uncharacterized protein n=1 Tax=Colocasia esculenta TaxID=4460 RepID=A0A843UUC1_COLES|nr:hypothetical protein [Colocasia esculenta]
MVHGGRSGRWSTSSSAPSTSAGRGSTPIGSASPTMPVVPVRLPTDYVGCPDDRVRLPADYVGCPGNRVRLPADYVGCPDDRVRFLPNSVTFHIPFTTRGKIDPGPASRYITSLVHAHVPGPVDSWKEFHPSVREFGDLPRARVVWKSTAQTSFRRSMWEARDKAAKTTGSQDSTAWMDYGPVWMRREYWESLCHRWATGPWQKRSQAAKCNRAAHSEKNRYELVRALTFHELFDRTHKPKGTDDYVSESARTIVETYDRTMANHFAEGSSQLDLDAEAWVDAAGGPSVRPWGQPGYYSSVVLICEFGRSSGVGKFIYCDAWQWWRGHENPHSGKAATALWHHDGVVGLCHPRSRPLKGSPSGQCYY